MALKKLTKDTSLLPSDHRTILYPDRFGLGYTQSEITLHDECGEKWYLGYHHQLELKGSFSFHFLIGDAIHEALAHWYNTGGEVITPELIVPDDVELKIDEQQDLARWNGVVPILLEQYYRQSKDDLSAWTIHTVEETLEYEYEGILLKGKVDIGYSIGAERMWVMDHKSYLRSDKSQVAGWEFRFQFMFYLWLVWKITQMKPKGFVVNAIKKPELKWNSEKKNLSSYIARVRADIIQTPDKYFQRHHLQLTKDSLERFEVETLQPKIERLKLLTQATTPANIVDVLARNRNTNTCSKYGHICQFLPLCKDGVQAAEHLYRYRPEKHVELDSE